MAYRVLFNLFFKQNLFRVPQILNFPSVLGKSKSVFNSPLRKVAVAKLNAKQLDPSWWQPNGIVRAIVKDGNTVYIGGDFSFIGPEATTPSTFRRIYYYYERTLHYSLCRRHYSISGENLK